MACAEGQTICELLADVGTGLGEFGNALLSGGGFIKLIVTLAVLGAVVLIVVNVAKLISGAIKIKGGKSM